MATRKELIAKIAELSQATANTGQISFKDLAVDANLTLPQLSVLFMLTSGPVRITDIALAQGMARPNASTMVERLVRKGLVERVSDANDRRVALTSLTVRGREVVDAVMISKMAAFERIAAVLSNDELELFARAMEILERGAKRLELAKEDANAVSGSGN